MFFRFPPDARWNPERFVVEFGIGVGEYEGVVHDASKPIIFTGPASNSSQRERFDGGS